MASSLFCWGLDPCHSLLSPGLLYPVPTCKVYYTKFDLLCQGDLALIWSNFAGPFDPLVSGFSAVFRGARIIIRIRTRFVKRFGSDFRAISREFSRPSFGFWACFRGARIIVRNSYSVCQGDLAVIFRQFRRAFCGCLSALGAVSRAQGKLYGL